MGVPSLALNRDKQSKMSCQGEEFSNTPSQAETTSEIPDSDAEKFPALFGVPQIMKSAPEEARTQLIDAVGYFFLGQVLSRFCDN